MQLSVPALSVRLRELSDVYHVARNFCREFSFADRPSFVFPENFSDCKIWVFLAWNVFLQFSGSRYRYSTLRWRNVLAFFFLSQAETFFVHQKSPKVEPTNNLTMCYPRPLMELKLLENTGETPCRDL